MRINYNSNLKQLARNLRNDSTQAEVVLWQHLRARKMRGYQFLRQKPVDNYIADFLCVQLRLIIEIDGESHADRDQHDADRQRKLEEHGFTVMRLDDRAVKTRTSSVVEGIHYWIEEWEKGQPAGFVSPARQARKEKGNSSSQLPRGYARAVPASRREGQGDVSSPQLPRVRQMHRRGKNIPLPLPPCGTTLRAAKGDLQSRGENIPRALPPCGTTLRAATGNMKSGGKNISHI